MSLFARLRTPLQRSFTSYATVSRCLTGNVRFCSTVPGDDQESAGISFHNIKKEDFDATWDKYVQELEVLDMLGECEDEMYADELTKEFERFLDTGFSKIQRSTFAKDFPKLSEVTSLPSDGDIFRAIDDDIGIDLKEMGFKNTAWLDDARQTIAAGREYNVPKDLPELPCDSMPSWDAMLNNAVEEFQDTYQDSIDELEQNYAADKWTAVDKKPLSPPEADPIDADVIPAEYQAYAEKFKA